MIMSLPKIGHWIRLHRSFAMDKFAKLSGSETILMTQGATIIHTMADTKARVAKYRGKSLELSFTLMPFSHPA